MNTKNILRIAVVVIVAAILGVVIWSGLKSNKSATSTNSTPTPTVPAITYNIPAADWKTYSSASLGFRVSYPKDWVQSNCGADCVAFALASAPDQLITGVSVSTGSLADIASRASPYSIGSSNVTFNGIKWLRLTLVQPQTGEVFTSHFAALGSKIYEFGINTTDTAQLDIYGRMVESFQFLKK